jgi:hypothetical protein
MYGLSAVICGSWIRQISSTVVWDVGHDLVSHLVSLGAHVLLSSWMHQRCSEWTC